MKSDDMKNIAIIAAVGIGAYMVYKFFYKTPATSEQITRTLQNSPSSNMSSTPQWKDNSLAGAAALLPAQYRPESWTARTLVKPAAYESTLSPGSTIILAPTANGSTTAYKFQPGDYEKLNVVQRGLLGTGALGFLGVLHVPTNWVLG